MTSVFSQSFSTSQADFRTSQSQQVSFSYSDSPLTQLPTLDFKYDDLRKRMNDFTQKFDAYIEQGRKRVFEERNDFRARLSELNGKSAIHDSMSTSYSDHHTPCAISHFLISAPYYIPFSRTMFSLNHQA